MAVAYSLDSLAPLYQTRRLKKDTTLSDGQMPMAFASTNFVLGTVTEHNIANLPKTLTRLEMGPPLRREGEVWPLLVTSPFPLLGEWLLLVLVIHMFPAADLTENT
jgi:hypothetical protein